MLKNIFRKDLELNKKWWHRLFKILFTIGLLIITYNAFIEYLEDSKNYYTKVENLDDRINNSVQKVEDMLKEGEIFTYSSFNPDEKRVWKEGIYCSDRLYDIENLNLIIGESGISNFNPLYRSKGDTNIQEFSRLLKLGGTKCIIEDNAEVIFLNTLNNYFNDFGFYKKSTIAYFTNSFSVWQFLVSLLIYLLFVYITYYKILLYIIYGNKKP